jgi:hypothetical protein
MSRDPDLKPVQSWITAHQLRQLKSSAALADQSVSELVARLIDQYLSAPALTIQNWHDLDIRVYHLVDRAGVIWTDPEGRSHEVPYSQAKAAIDALLEALRSPQGGTR